MIATLCLVATAPLIGGEPRPLEDNHQALWERLPGYWHGEAVETPVGQMNYDLLFHLCNDNLVAGVARTGASLHYWQFRREDGSLKIRFLSTFGGNRTPTWLIPMVTGGTGLHFRAPERKILTLTIQETEQRIHIRVFHYGEPHVYIRLNERSEPPATPDPQHTEANSCRGAPAE